MKVIHIIEKENLLNSILNDGGSQEFSKSVFKLPIEARLMKMFVCNVPV